MEIAGWPEMVVGARSSGSWARGDQVQQFIGQNVLNRMVLLKSWKMGMSSEAARAFQMRPPLTPGQSSRETHPSFSGHVVRAERLEFFMPTASLSTSPSSDLAVQVLAVREHHHQLLFVGGHLLDDVEPMTAS
jgi:hypothetical protein